MMEITAQEFSLLQNQIVTLRTKEFGKFKTFQKFKIYINEEITI
jgi:hypothetical protein